MSVILLHTLKSMGKRPVQTAIIVASVILVTACLLLIVAFPSLFREAYFTIADRTYGEAVYNLDYIAFPENEEEAALYDEMIADVLGTDFITIVRTGETSARVGNVNMLIDLTVADDLDAFNAFNNVQTVETAEGEIPSDCLPACISSYFAEKTGLRTRDTFEIVTVGKVFVTAVVEDDSMYFSHPNPRVAVERYHSTLPSPYSVQVYGDYSDDEITALVKRLSQTEGIQSAVRYVVDEYATDFAEARTAANMPPIYVAAVLIIAVMVVLLRLSCSSVMRARAEELARFKAAGATPAQCVLILMGEIVLYSVAGGLIGLGAGKLLVNALLAGFRIASALSFTLSWWMYVAAFALALVTALSAALAVSAHFASQSSKQLLANRDKTARTLPFWVPLIFAAATVAFGVAPVFANGVEVYVFMVLFLCSACLFTATVVPYAVRMLASVGQRVKGSGAGYVALKNAVACPAVGRTATALALLICFVFTGSMLIDAVKQLSSSDFDRFKSDYVVQCDDVKSEAAALDFVEECEALPGVSHVRLATRVATTLLPKHENVDFRSIFVVGVCRAEDLKTFCKTDDGTVERFENADYPVVISYTIALELGLEVGDEFVFEYYKDATDGAPLTVVGIDTTVSNYDMFAYVPFDVSVRMGKTPATFYMYGDADAETLAEYFAGRAGVRFYESENYIYDTTSFSMGSMISSFGTIVYIAAALGLVNLIAVSSSERKRERELFRLAGFTPADSARFHLAEAVSAILLGGVAGTVYGLAITSVLRPFSRVLGKYVAGYVSALSLVPIALTACALTLLCWMTFNLLPLAFASLRRKRHAQRVRCAKTLTNQR